MTHKPKRHEHECTTPDHRPMLPEFRLPEDVLDAAVRQPRRRMDEIDPTRRMKWR